VKNSVLSIMLYGANSNSVLNSEFGTGINRYQHIQLTEIAEFQQLNNCQLNIFSGK
jgi:hypothetical protein